MLRSHYHCVYSMNFHLVLVTKYRKKVFSQPILERLESIIKDVCKKWDVTLDEFRGEEDHIHLLISMHPSLQPSKFINNLKTVSSRRLRSEYTEYMKKFYWKPTLWTRAYCLLSTGGANIETIRKYIQNQGKEEGVTAPDLTKSLNSSFI